MGWAVYKSAVEDNVVPEDDLREHEISCGCRCMPEPRQWHGHMVYIHRAWDGREITEQAEVYAAAGRN